MKKLLWSCISLAFIACGGSDGSGVSSSKKLTELDAAEQDKLCAFIIDVYDAPRTVTCSDGATVTLDSESACDFADVSASCQATVGDAEGCAEAFSDDPCEPDFSACAALLECAFSE